MHDKVGIDAALSRVIADLSPPKKSKEASSAGGAGFGLFSDHCSIFAHHQMVVVAEANIGTKV